MVKDGILKNFLMGRLPVKNFSNSNGHGRAQAGLMPVGRQGNLIVTSSKTIPDAQLRARFIEEIKKQGKPYGLYFEDIQGGFTLTTRDLPQAFQVLPVMVWRVYADGRPDELVRGVDIVGTPLTVLTQIAATGDTTSVFNGICGAESGSVPVSAAAPAMLFSEMEVQKRKYGDTRPPILPPPPGRDRTIREASNDQRRRAHTDCRRCLQRSSCAILLCAIAASARAADSASGDVVLRALREEMERSKTKLKMDNVPAPYYIEYRVTEIDQFEASAVFGALRNQQHNHGRLLRVVVRVGDYKQDSFYGSGEGTIDLVPSDDDVFAIRHRIWLATDRAYKAASEALSAKQAALKQLKVDEPVDDFAKASPVEAVEPLARFSSTDFTAWIHLLEEASAQYRTDKELENFESSLRFTVENRYFLNSEGTVARSGHTHYVISIAGSTQAADGMLLQRSHADQGNDLKELPTREEFLKTTTRILETLKLLRDAPVVDEEYRGPVLFSNDAAATVVTELVEPNVLGRKPQLGENARTTGKWSSSYKSRVLPDFVNVFDDPTISTISGQPLFGNYTLDDEGVKAQRVSLIEKGQLVSYLIGRQPIRDFPASNGHGRAAAHCCACASIPAISFCNRPIPSLTPASKQS